MASVNVGEIRHEIQLVRTYRKKDANDHYVTDEESVTLRAAVRAVSARELVEYGADLTQETLQFIVRWYNRRKINDDMTVIWRGKRYGIIYIDPTPWAGIWCRIKAAALEGSGAEWMG